MAAMNLAALRAEVQAIRFNSTDDSSRIDKWLNYALTQLWALDDWVFKKATTSPTVTGGSRTLAGTPSTGFISRAIWDDQGNRLRYLPTERFYDLYSGDTSTGQAVHYTVTNQTVQVAPTPAGSATWTMFYEKRVAQLANDNSIPLIPTEYHYVLVPGAIMFGGAIHSDFTSQFVQGQWEQGIAALRRDYVADTRGEPVVWPASRVGSFWG